MVADNRLIIMDFVKLHVGKTVRWSFINQLFYNDLGATLLCGARLIPAGRKALFIGRSDYLLVFAVLGDKNGRFRS